MKSILRILIVFAALVGHVGAVDEDEGRNAALDKAGAPTFHACGEQGQLLVTGFIAKSGEFEVWNRSMIRELLMAINFDPVVRKAILDGIARQRETKKQPQVEK